MSVSTGTVLFDTLTLDVSKRAVPNDTFLIIFLSVLSRDVYDLLLQFIIQLACGIDGGADVLMLGLKHFYEPFNEK